MTGRYDAWHNVKDRMPRNYDLVRIMQPDGTWVAGWWNGSRWDSRRIIKQEDVVQWSNHHKSK